MLTSHAMKTIKELSKIDKFERRPVLDAAITALVYCDQDGFVRTDFGAQLVAAAVYEVEHHRYASDNLLSWAREVLCCFEVTGADRTVLCCHRSQECSTWRIENEIIRPLAEVSTEERERPVRQRRSKRAFDWC